MADNANADALNAARNAARNAADGTALDAAFDAAYDAVIDIDDNAMFIAYTIARNIIREMALM
jgi:hypothetical protein